MTKPLQRELHFERVDEAMAEVDHLSAIDVRVTGQHSFAAIVEHLARTLDIVTGHATMPPPHFLMRIAGRLMRPMVLRQMSPGFRLPAKAQSVLWPDHPVDLETTVAHFRKSLERYQLTPELPRHVYFGNMTRSQHDRLQCNHCALHLSFVHPVD